jgi:uncharacterized protein (TIGR04141 family)
MTLKSIKFNLKIFSIDRTHRELKEKNTGEIVDVIQENHKKYFHANDNDLSVVRPNINHHSEGDYEFYTYCYNQPKDQNYWKYFLPKELSQNQNFDLIEFSFVLFIIYNSRIYCVVGGSGYSVIKKYQQSDFGIDLYQHFAKPYEDTLLGVNLRGVAGSISQKEHIFAYNQTVNESFEYSEIPKKIKVLVRKELKDGIFKKYNLDSERAIMEIGAYFSLRKKIDFENLKKLIRDIDLILSDKSNYVQLTLFKKVRDETTNKALSNELKQIVASDIVLHNTPAKLNQLNNKGIIELVNKKLELFYECNEYHIRFQKTHNKNNVIVKNKDKLYLECTKHIFNSLDNINDKNEIIKKIFTLDINGVINNKNSTFGNLFSHLSAEIPYLNRKYFRIDENWYHLDDKFIERINEEAINTYNQFKLNEDLLNKWKSGWDEDAYNLDHKDKGDYFILDKVIKENIEICDILVLKNDTLYFIHVKNGFNTQMRNLYNQVVLSAKRLWTDLNNNSGSEYFEKTLEYYNKRNPKNQFNTKSIYEKIIQGDIKIEFVMAYNNFRYSGQSSAEKINSSQSNIAKYCLVQTVREMRNFRRFGISIIDISEI